VGGSRVACMRIREVKRCRWITYLGGNERLKVRRLESLRGRTNGWTCPVMEIKRVASIWNDHRERKKARAAYHVTCHNRSQRRNPHIATKAEHSDCRVLQDPQFNVATGAKVQNRGPNWGREKRQGRKKGLICLPRASRRRLGP